MPSGGRGTRCGESLRRSHHSTVHPDAIKVGRRLGQNRFVEEADRRQRTNGPALPHWFRPATRYFAVAELIWGGGRRLFRLQSG
jgi:hypothetical protein